MSTSSSDINAAYTDVAATVKSDEQAIVTGAVTYLETALSAVQTQAAVVVKEVGADSEALAFKVAGEHGFSAFLSMFKSSIDNGTAQIEAAISNETTTLVQEAITKLKNVKVA